MRKLNYSFVDVFTERPLLGMPLAVFTLTSDVPTPVLQRLARELSHAETAFVFPPRAGGTAFVRVFAPSRELPFTANSAVGCAYVIGRSAPLGLLRFETGFGVVDVIIEREGGFVSRCVATQPMPEFRELEADRGELLAALGVAPVGTIWEASNGPSFTLAQVDDVDAVRPDLGVIGRLGGALAVYELPREKTVRQRVFRADDGAAEEPVTGSLAGIVARRLLLDGHLPEGELNVSQGSQIERPGTVWVSVTRDRTPYVGGACASVARGFVEVPFVL